MLWSFFIGIGEKAFSEKKMKEKEEAAFYSASIRRKNNSTTTILKKNVYMPIHLKCVPHFSQNRFINIIRNVLYIWYIIHAISDMRALNL